MATTSAVIPRSHSTPTLTDRQRGFGILAHISAQDEQIDAVELRLAESLKQNTDLTAEINELTKLIHQTVCVGWVSGKP
jgi:hypothetical protein